MATTADGFPYPAATEPLGDGHQWMQDMAEFLQAHYKPWTAYTPTFTNLTVGNGTLKAAYCHRFGVVDFVISLRFGTTTAITAIVDVDVAAPDLPIAEDVSVLVGNAIGWVLGIEVDAGTRRAGVLVTPGLGGSEIEFNGETNQMNATVPWTWEDQDELYIRGSYRTNVALP